VFQQQTKTELIQPLENNKNHDLIKNIDGYDLSINRIKFDQNALLDIIPYFYNYMLCTFVGCNTVVVEVDELNEFIIF
jgi:hypothetical protein